ncbi:hypothetical protein GEMRC1_013926 [Eukaryota sp. GEM-RC1]
MAYSFNERALNFISSPVETSKLLGQPGAGKSLCIFYFLKAKIEEGVLQFPHDFILLTFSKTTVSDLLLKASRFSLPYFNDKNVRTFHSLAGSICYARGIRSSLRSCIPTATELLKSDSLDDIFSLYRLKLIIVDEAQDLNPIQFFFVETLSKSLNIPLILVGDTNQSIFSFQGSDPAILDSYNVSTFSLIVNYRSSKPIIDGGKEKGNHPVEIIVTSKTELEGEILSKIQYFKNLGLCYEDICILGPVKLSRYKHNSIGLQAVANILERSSIPYNVRYRRASLNNNEVDFLDPVPGQVNLLTIHGSKGLEFKAVILLNFHFSSMGRVPDQEEFQQSKFLWYVGCSRAQEFLSIFAYKDRPIHPLFDKISNLPNVRVFGQPNVQYPSFNDKKYLQFRDSVRVTDLTAPNFLNSVEYDQFSKFFKDFGPSRMIYQSSKLINTQLDSFSLFPDIYGLLFEKLVQIFYHAKFKTLLGYFQNLKSFYEQMIHVPKQFKPAVVYLYRFFGFTANDQFKLYQFKRHYHSLSQVKYVREFVDFLILDPSVPHSVGFSFIIDDPLLYDVTRVPERLEILNSLVLNVGKLQGVVSKFVKHGTIRHEEIYGGLISKLWRFLIINEHFVGESLSILSTPMPNLFLIMNHVHKLLTIATTLPPDLILEHPVKHGNIGLLGCLDGWHPGTRTIYEFKTCLNDSLEHVFQCSLYRECIYSESLSFSNQDRVSIKIINLLTGRIKSDEKRVEHILLLI